MVRRCSKCKLSKPLDRDHFHKDGTRSKNGGWAYVCKACYAEHKAPSVFKSNLKLNYGITPDGYYQMVKDQNNMCAICSNTCRLSIDHNHATGQVRALLCTNCNHLIGKAKENVNILINALHYLNKWNGKYE